MSSEGNRWVCGQSRRPFLQPPARWGSAGAAAGRFGPRRCPFLKDVLTVKFPSAGSALVLLSRLDDFAQCTLPEDFTVTVLHSSTQRSESSSLDLRRQPGFVLGSGTRICRGQPLLREVRCWFLGRWLGSWSTCDTSRTGWMWVRGGRSEARQKCCRRGMHSTLQACRWGDVQRLTHVSHVLATLTCCWERTPEGKQFKGRKERYSA